MTDPERPDEHVSPTLRPVVARLREIHRKCRSLASRNDEAEEMAARLEGVIDALTAEDGRPDLGAIARDLFPVARLFESLGFMGVARELAHVERTLRELDPGVGSSEHAADFGEPSSARMDDPTQPEPEVDRESADADRPERESRRLPTPVAVGLVAVLVAVVASILVVRHQMNLHRTATDVGATPAATATPPGSDSAIARPPPPPETAESAATPTPSSGARLAALLGEARLAQQEGDIDRAISLLSRAALIESKAQSVISTSRSLVSDLLARADAAADDARWDEAAEYVDRARELAIRFELPTESMDEATRRHARLERFERVDPANRTRLAELAGRRALVITRTEDRFEGRIHDVRSGVLELHQGLEVGRGGTLYHVEAIELAEVAEIRVYPE